MKKLILILVVVAMAAPLYAQGVVTFVATDNADGTCTVTFDANDTIGINAVAMALNVEVTGSDPCHLITAVSGMDSFFEIYMDFAYDDPCTYGYGDGHPVADPCAAGSATLPSHNFCISMGGLGGETDPDEKPAPDNGDAFILTAGNLDDPCDAVTGAISLNALRGGVIGTDTEAMDTNINSLPFTITNVPPDACVKDTAPFYNEWLGYEYTGNPTATPWTRPDCWCYKRNCRGDADGIKPADFRVQTADLTILVAAFNKGDKKLDNTKICADFDRLKPADFRVQTDDLTILVASFNKGDKKYDDCPMDWDGDTDDDYNFWTTDPCDPNPLPE